MDFKENMRKFGEFLKVIKGKADVRERLSFLFQPQNIKTASRLSGPQCEFVADSYLAESFYAEFKPMRQLADEVAETMISHKGLGRNEAIDFEKASRKGLPEISLSQITGAKEVEKKERHGKE